MTARHAAATLPAAMLLQFPIGLHDPALGWPELRPLAAAGLGPDQVLAGVFALWTELAQQAGATGRVGWLPESGRAGLLARLPGLAPLFGPGGLCVPEGGGGGGWVCDRFARLHPHLAPGYTTKEKKGLALANYRKAQAGRPRAEQLSLLMAAEKLGDATPEEAGRVAGLIYSVDCALGRSTRRVADADYPPALVAEALAAGRRWPVEQLDLIVEAVCGLVGHPALPNTAETLLPRLPQLVELPEMKAEMARLATRRRR